MQEDGIKVTYEVTRKAVEKGLFKGEEAYGIKGKNLSTGEIFVKEGVSLDRIFAEKLASLLSENRVSVIHAEDVIKDLAGTPFTE